MGKLKNARITLTQKNTSEAPYLYSIGFDEFTTVRRISLWFEEKPQVGMATVVQEGQRFTVESPEPINVTFHCQSEDDPIIKASIDAKGKDTTFWFARRPSKGSQVVEEERITFTNACGLALVRPVEFKHDQEGMFLDDPTSELSVAFERTSKISKNSVEFQVQSRANISEKLSSAWFDVGNKGNFTHHLFGFTNGKLSIKSAGQPQEGAEEIKPVGFVARKKTGVPSFFEFEVLSRFDSLAWALEAGDGEGNIEIEPTPDLERTDTIIVSKLDLT